ncbi:hypothetical protein C1645_18997 [Glomus cerebriforme]|uniref:Uncharacterized protein n=1 Tax=Glomus cerebriforme TaxID=658196 RepID=A0A397T642_9GLOM|nr:hypothetical protein C1645_18997 [Glomus cerebriforme]
MVSGLIIAFSTALGALIGSVFSAKGAAITGSIFFFGSIIACIAFFILAVYHLIQ